MLDPVWFLDLGSLGPKTRWGEEPPFGRGWGVQHQLVPGGFQHTPAGPRSKGRQKQSATTAGKPPPLARNPRQAIRRMPTLLAPSAGQVRPGQPRLDGRCLRHERTPYIWCRQDDDWGLRSARPVLSDRTHRWQRGSGREASTEVGTCIGVVGPVRRRDRSERSAPRPKERLIDSGRADPGLDRTGAFVGL